MWGRGVLPAALPTPFSATLSPALLVYLRECGAAGLLVVRLPAPFVPHSTSLGPTTATRVLSALAAVWMNVYFLSTWCQTSLPSIFCQFWLCKEAHCVYLHLHLGSPQIIF